MDIRVPIKLTGPYMQPEDMVRGEFGAAMRSETTIPYGDPQPERRSIYRGVETTYSKATSESVYGLEASSQGIGDIGVILPDMDMEVPEPARFRAPDVETSYQSPIERRGSKLQKFVRTKSQTFF